MRGIIVLILVFFLLGADCRREPLFPVNDQGAATKLPFLWKFNLHKQEPTSNSIISAHMIHDDKVFVGTTDGFQNKFLSAVNLETGEEEWSWNELYQNPTECFDLNSFHINNNGLLYFVIGTRNYCLNIEDGKTFWKMRRDTTFSSKFYGKGDHALVIGYVDDIDTGYSTKKGLTVNINDGVTEHLVTPSYTGDYVSPRNSIGGVNYVVPVPGEDNLFIVQYQEPLPSWNYRSYIGLYDAKENEWIYEHVLLSDLTIKTVNNLPAINGNRVYLALGRKMICISLWTGTKLWERDFPLDFLFSGLIAVDNMVITNNEIGRLYCLDSETGNTLHTHKTAGTSSRLRYLNGVVYLSGGSTSRIHAYDTETNKMVWELDPNLYDDESSDWKPDIYVSPAKNGDKGKVIVSTHAAAYCIEAFR